MTRAAACVVLAGLLAGGSGRSAFADDSKDTADTLASPWSGVALRLAEDDKRFLVAASTLFSPGVRVRGELSAPLDEDTRTAVFFDNDGLAPAFRGSLFIGYDSTWRTLALTSSDTALLAECERLNLTPCTGTKLAELRNRAAQATTDRKRDGQPLASGVLTWTLGLDVAFAYDRETAFLDDVGANGETREFSSSDLQLGISALVQLPQNWVITGRVGYQRANNVELGTFRRCMTLTSSDPTTSGQDCSDERYLKSDPDPEHTMYARSSLGYYPAGGLLGSYVSTAELRLNLEQLMSEAESFDTHLLVFMKGSEVAGSRVRIGLGTTVRTTLESFDIYDYSLFGIAGASF